MASRRRFVAGLAGVLLGNVLMTAGYVLDSSLLGPVTAIAMVGALLAGVGVSILLYLAVTDPEKFEFDGSTAARRAPTVVLIGGVGTVIAGVVTLALALSG